MHNTDQFALGHIRHLEMEAAQYSCTRDGFVVLDKMDGPAQCRLEMLLAPRFREMTPVIPKLSGSDHHGTINIALPYLQWVRHLHNQLPPNTLINATKLLMVVMRLNTGLRSARISRAYCGRGST